MKTPHKHAALIKAWADGAEIEVERVLYGWVNASTPQWLEQAVYRIKPEPKPDVVHTVKARASGFCIFNSETKCVSAANLKLTFDGETGKLKAAEVL